MMIELRYTLKRMLGGMLGWGVSLALLGAFIIAFYDPLMDPAQVDDWKNLLSTLPREIMVFFGDIQDFSSPVGYLTLEFFSFMPVVLGIYALIAGSGMVAADEESGRLDLVLAHPISRTALFFSRVLGFCASLVGILMLSWLGLVLTSGSSKLLNVSAGELLLPFFSLGAVTLAVWGLAVFLAQVLPAKRLAAMVTGFYLVASYFITSLANLSDTLDAVKPLSLLNYYQSGDAMHGLALGNIAGLVLITALLVAAAWLLFLRRDIRVAGEGSWQFKLVRLGRWRKFSANS